MALATETVEASRLSDEELVQCILAGEKQLFEIVMRRYNQRLYRVTRAILRNDAEAEDVAQEAYVRAYQHLNQFAGRSSFATWLTRIAIHEALGRMRSRKKVEEIDAMDEPRRDSVQQLSLRDATPEQAASGREVRSLLEHSIDALPDTYREIFMLREVEEMTTSETAQCLGISEENVKTRLHRARALLRKEIYARAGATSTAAFQFMGARCDRMVENVMQRIAQLTSNSTPAN
jgi:RNA polymerase sigma-70 factor (ECF subfamily)